MQFSTKEDIEAPIAEVFDMLYEFESFERAAMRRGAEVRRVDDLAAPGVGMMWQAVFDLRGKRREVELERRVETENVVENEVVAFAQEAHFVQEGPAEFLGRVNRVDEEIVAQRRVDSDWWRQLAIPPDTRDLREKFLHAPSGRRKIDNRTETHQCVNHATI